MLTILESCLHSYYIDMFDVRLLLITEMYHNCMCQLIKSHLQGSSRQWQP